MEIEVGEYARTYNKGIKKIDRINNNKTVNKYLYFTGVEDFEGKEYAYIKTTEIVNHSKNIINLLEVGDICFLDDDFVYIYDEEFIDAVKRDIKRGNKLISILTHEQYSANAYKLEKER